MIASIYKISNLINNKVYIGSTKSFKTRKYFHLYQLKNGIHHSSHLQKSYNKYGKNKFTFELIEECNNNIRKERELYFINLYNSFNRDYGYNNDLPNEDNFKHSISTNNKIRNSEYHKNKSIAIDMYDLFGNFIKSYDTINICSKDRNIYSVIIHDIIIGKRKSYKGYTFVLKDQQFNYLPSKKQRNMTLFYK